MEYADAILGLKVFNYDYFYMFSWSRNAQIIFVEKPQLILYYTLLEKPAYNQQYSVHAPSHEYPL